MQIQILSVNIEHKPGKNGGYKVADVAYKDESGKTQGKKVMSFASQSVFNVISEAQAGDVFDIKSEKDNNGYWQWTSAVKGGQMSVAPAQGKAGVPAPKSTYETPEERAKKQVFIVRQSSISAALEFSKSVKALKTKEEVVELAKYFEAYVFDTGEEQPTEYIPGEE